MDIKEIENLIKFVSAQKNVGEVEIEKKDFKIVIRKPVTQMVSAPQYIQAAAPAAPAASAPALPAAPFLGRPGPRPV